MNASLSQVWGKVINAPIVITGLLGGNLLMGGWMGSLPKIAFFGGCLMLISIGLIVTRITTRGEDIAASIKEDIALSLEKKINKKHLEIGLKLYELDRNSTEKEKSRRASMRAIRDIWESFKIQYEFFKNVNKKEDNPEASSFVVEDLNGKIKAVFDLCLGEFEEFISQYSPRTPKDREKNRIVILDSIESKIAKLEEGVISLRRHINKTTTEDGSKALQELDNSLEMARKIEDRMSTIGQSSIDVELMGIIEDSH